MTNRDIEKREQEAIKTVEEFIQQLENQQISVDSSAITISFTNVLDGSQTNLAEMLYESIEAYRFMKNTQFKGQYADNLTKNIERIHSYGLINNSTDFVKRMKILEKTNLELKNQNEDYRIKLEKLSSEFLILKGEKQELEKQLNRAFKSKGGSISR